MLEIMPLMADAYPLLLQNTIESPSHGAIDIGEFHIHIRCSPFGSLQLNQNKQKLAG
jgi:hypothetical protein